jgi:CBS domain-containing protein
MPKSFNFDAAPFDCLTPEQSQWVRDSVDIAYFPEGATLIAPGDAPACLFVIIKGHVQQTDQGEVLAVFGPDQSFDGRSLVAAHASHLFTAAEEVIVYQVPRDLLLRLIALNSAFGALLLSDISKKMKALDERRSQRETHALMMTPLEQAFVRPAQFVEETLDVYQVAELLEREHLTHVLVRRVGSEEVGIFTSTDVRRALLSSRSPHQLPVGELTTWSLIEAQYRSSVFEALILMIRHGVHRVVVVRDGKIMGVMEQLDLLSFISNHSHLIWAQVQKASTLGELKEACANIHRLIALLSESQVRVGMIARLVQELNTKVYTRLWHMIAPEELIQNSAVIVMGSEGRGEQILRTDQDNGLIIRDGFECTELGNITARFNDALYEFGFPPCKGGIMMRNPLWCQHLSNFKETIRQWVFHPNPETHMRLAIFSDANTVCGEHAFLQELKEYFYRSLQDSPTFFAHFARAADSFAEQNSWWSRLLGGGDANEIDIKKLGIFPIVHGIRSLALEKRLEATSTEDRIEALVQRGALPEDNGTDLKETLAFLMEIRLKQGLTQLALGQRPDNIVRISELSTLERDLLRDSLQLVKGFRSLLHHHFKLDAV